MNERLQFEINKAKNDYGGKQCWCGGEYDEAGYRRRKQLDLGVSQGSTVCMRLLQGLRDVPR